MTLPIPVVARKIGHHRHQYQCTCLRCIEDRARLQPARCACVPQPVAYVDPGTGELSCLRCGRPPEALPAAA